VLSVDQKTGQAPRLDLIRIVKSGERRYPLARNQAEFNWVVATLTAAASHMEYTEPEPEKKPAPKKKTKAATKKPAKVVTRKAAAKKDKDVTPLDEIDALLGS
jgi:hypothetical protein